MRAFPPLALIAVATCALGADAPWTAFPIAVTPENEPVVAYVGDFDIDSPKFRPLFVCDPGDINKLPTKWSDAISPSAIEIPSGVSFPPGGTAYQGEHAPEQGIWRWFGMHAPDVIIDLRSDGREGLSKALAANKPSDVGIIPVVTPDLASGGSLADVATAAAEKAAPGGSSPARAELQKRKSRSPLEVAEALSAHYPGKMSSIAYIPALALIGRMRIAELTGEEAHMDFARQELGKWLDAEAETPKNVSGPYIAGSLMFAEYARRTGDERAWDWVMTAGGVGLTPDGKPVAVLPSHNEMSDAVFMGCPLMAAAAAHSGDERYLTTCLNQLLAIQNWCLRGDGIYRHSPLDEAAWGRGNGFPALGLALVLSELDPDVPNYDVFLESLQSHLAALIPHQDASGMFHQVIDHPESYREFTSTCMISFAITRGMRKGWLDRETYEPVVDQAWEAIKLRVAMDGQQVVDSCTGTGKQKDLRAYYERKAILGRDDRAGAMALMFATEREFWMRER